MSKLTIDQVVDEIPFHAKVLDLGCGSGDLLFELINRKHVIGYGIDINSDNILTCLKKDINVMQVNLDEGLTQFSDYSFDYVIFSQTLQEVQHPLHILREILRIGKKCIITFPNFAFISNRFQIMLGMTPKQSALPYDWFETPNIRFLSIKDFKDLCRREGICIQKQLSSIPAMFENIFSDRGKFIISKQIGGKND